MKKIGYFSSKDCTFVIEIEKKDKKSESIVKITKMPEKKGKINSLFFTLDEAKFILEFLNSPNEKPPKDYQFVNYPSRET